MRVLIVTVAGLSTRFSQTIGRSCLKCIYHEKDITESLLYRILKGSPQADKFVIVGGFLFEELKETIGSKFGEFQDKILLVKNEKFEEYGSGYSLYMGFLAIKNMEFDEVVFAEGDLWVDGEDYTRVWDCRRDVITCSREPVLASKSVAFYYDRNYHIHYIFDTSHSLLEIGQPFRGIFNSGQIWKFVSRKRVLHVMDSLTEEEWKETNLKFVQEYFDGIDKEGYELIEFKKWINCNTVDDFLKIENEENRNDTFR